MSEPISHEKDRRRDLVLEKEWQRLFEEERDILDKLGRNDPQDEAIFAVRETYEERTEPIREEIDAIEERLDVGSRIDRNFSWVQDDDEGTAICAISGVPIITSDDYCTVLCNELESLNRRKG